MEPIAPLPSDWDAMWKLLWLPAHERVPGGKANDVIGAPLGLRLGQDDVFRVNNSNVSLRTATAETYGGLRYGRRVTVHPRSPTRARKGWWLASSVTHSSRTRLLVSARGLRIESKRTGLVAREGGGLRLEGVLDALSAARRWKNVEVLGAGDGLTVERRIGIAYSVSAMRDWIYDLWLAEQLADALDLRPL